MNTKKTISLLALALPLAAMAPNALAHRQWLLASTAVLSGEDQWISVDAAISNDLFFPNHHAIPVASIQAIAPSGKSLELQNPVQGKIRSGFELQLQEQGSYRIFSGREMLMVTWEENGERKRRRGSPEEIAAMDLASMDKLQLRESISRVETIVTCGAPSTLETIGRGLEFAFLSHPNDLFAGESARFRVLLNGKPASDVEVTVVKGDDRFRNAAGERNIKSDAEGVIAIDWNEPGRYWLNASTSVEGGDFNGHPLQRSASYALTVDVLPE